MTALVNCHSDAKRRNLLFQPVLVIPTRSGGICCSNLYLSFRREAEESAVPACTCHSDAQRRNLLFQPVLVIPTRSGGICCSNLYLSFRAQRGICCEQRHRLAPFQ